MISKTRLPGKDSRFLLLNLRILTGSCFILHEKAVQRKGVIKIKFFDMLARENNTRVLNISLIVTEFTIQQCIK